ncbi:MAG TPA: BRCT domain-containing protein [Pseudomonadales bacterium]|jgi:NAD-dependent DNA ligase|nr:BRCT domain-containing protein [Pseudomonadales bacterium]HJL61778.1 BRCT domain-containing protein [Pseudomonadales bacterium]HJP49395.1 BRCT domain-containing protein [Pseudomonadales bacterium]|tara:strand:+ start:168 stop:773 length:606 start_codon:yes stop_codon:yes gene_type:complete
MGKSARSKTASRIQDRLIDELIGVCRGVIADGIVDENEAIFLGQWIENHREIADRWPVNILYARLTEMLKDGVLSESEEAELLSTLRDITGESSLFQEPNRSTTLPLDIPLPDIEFEGKTFCLTGRFVFGSTLDCEETIAELGGSLADSPARGTDYLIIGEMCSPDWVHTTFGRSIEHAVELREQGSPIAIVSEEHWVNSL